jgi:hypothetical protein
MHYAIRQWQRGTKMYLLNSEMRRGFCSIRDDWQGGNLTGGISRPSIFELISPKIGGTVFGNAFEVIPKAYEG